MPESVGGSFVQLTPGGARGLALPGAIICHPLRGFEAACGYLQENTSLVISDPFQTSRRFIAEQLDFPDWRCQESARVSETLSDERLE